ncbi:sulfatase-like hydrolase/transferase [Ruania halotolerans]|uniref:sulfatase-like hydrolase/transferase n=1 Tax=Ruania halotolerans TaxID=2897773 RepID=UPI001E4013A9|nr:sulfatase-like hydrolase/transferase [Ruania halotolerans]UFU06143.1 sulfatase-like hydrolase/transferase [Ruania halotolerans]
MTDRNVRRPNVVLFNPDQWRGDVLGHVGNLAAVTPTLDRMVAEDAVSFTNAFCQNPVCTPSRTSFMTGWYPHVRGHRTMHHMLQPDEPNLLRTLKQEGYTVWWGGKNDLVPAQRGFEDHCDVKNTVPEETLPLFGGRSDPETDPDFYRFFVGRLDTPDGTDHYPDSDWAHVHAAIDFIRAADPDQPFCLYLPLTYPHPPYAVEDPWYSMIDRDALPTRVPAPDWTDKPSILPGIQAAQGGDWPEKKWNELRATYYAMCARVDHQLSLILGALREAGAYDDTAVFVFPDHGDFTGDYGLVEKTQNTFEDCLTNVPLVVKPPASIPVRARTCEALVELIDMPATVEELSGITPEHTHFGRSLVPLLTAETDEHRDAVFCEGGRLQDEEHAMELQSASSQSRPEESRYWPRMRLQSSPGPEHTKAAMCRTRDYKYVRRLYEKDELYDLRSDPQELVNRIDDPALAPVRSLLTDRLLTWYQETADVVPHRGDQR